MINASAVRVMPRWKPLLILLVIFLLADFSDDVGCSCNDPDAYPRAVALHGRERP